jgi:hypothetical protein
MANRFAVPVTQLVNDSASGIASGWKLNFYTTGTSTRKDTFSDNALTTANANPVVADSSGRFGDIFLGSGDYKVVLTDDNDVVKWTADPVTGSIGTSGDVDAKTAAYTITTGDATKTIAVDATSGALTVTLPTAASATNSFEVTIKKTDSSANAVTIDGSGAETIDGATTFVLSNENDFATLRCDGSNWFVVAAAEGSATETVEGIAEIATVAETKTGTDNARFVTPLKARFTKGADIPSADPLVLGTDGDYFDVTGTTNFASITVAIGRFFVLQFDGVLTMTHNATTLDLPSEANITTAAGDSLIGFATAANQVHVISYARADGTAIGGAATQAEQETGTSTAVMVTPGRQQFHQSAAKGSVQFDVSVTVQSSYNVTTVTDNNPGDWTVNWVTDFSSADYSVFVSIEAAASVNRKAVTVAGAAGTTQVNTLNGATIAETSVNWVYAVAYGDQ